MSVISKRRAPTPAQAATIFRALREVDLQAQNLDHVEMLLNVLQELLVGNKQSFMHLSREDFATLDKYVEGILLKSGFGLKNEKMVASLSENSNIKDRTIKRYHVMTLLRTLGSLDNKKIENVRLYKKVRMTLYWLLQGRYEFLRDICISDDEDDIECRRIIFESLQKVLDEEVLLHAAN